MNPHIMFFFWCYRHWRFSESGLEKARRDLNEGAVGRVKSKLEEERVECFPFFFLFLFWLVVERFGLRVREMMMMMMKWDLNQTFWWLMLMIFITPESWTWECNELEGRSGDVHFSHWVSNRRRWMVTGDILSHQDLSTLSSIIFSIPRNCRGDCNVIPQAILSEKHLYGLSSQEHHVRSCFTDGFDSKLVHWIWSRVR